MERGINICRPGYGASCALCCGSHNYDASPGDIATLMYRRRKAFRYYSRDYIIKTIQSSRSDLTGSYYYRERKHPFTLTLDPLFDGCLQCPYVTFIDDNEALGCFLYPENGGDRNRDCYNVYRSKNFTCPARESLSENEILYAACLTGDWFYYSILIHAAPLLQAIMEKYPRPDEVDTTALERLKQDLWDRIRSDKSLHGIHTYFG
ncbi:MAG: hypothetical protein CVV44_02090 [Spirochaetae bacterium HGW-Spirochaetae-1]|jgi:hypothetical protein|nr:MAG: hypothetical protein CVV44_02090 [Spirochaetae bacterium HGW-Spirochaetae-1]